MRLFTAVWPPPRIEAMLNSLPTPNVDRLRWTPPGSWHVTLVFHGDADLDTAVAQMEAVVLPAEPVTASLGPKVGRFGDKVLHIPVRGLDDLALAFGAEPGFRGHLTLARASGARLAKHAGRQVRGSWPVNEVTLVRSHLGGTRATYEVVHRRSLP